jgi:hypothetical protein
MALSGRQITTRMSECPSGTHEGLPRRRYAIMSQEVSMPTLTRREALRITGLGAVAVAEFGGGATLFHEHLSLGPDFGDRFRAAAAAVLTARGESPPANAPHHRPRLQDQRSFQSSKLPG